MTPREIYDTYLYGNRIEDQDVLDGIVFYKDMFNKLVQCGPVFKLAANEAYKVYSGLCDYAVHRKLKLPG